MLPDYSTLTQQARHRFDYWHEVVCRHCIPAHSQCSVEQEGFEASLSVRSLGLLEISAMSAPSHRWVRNNAHLRTHARDDLWLGCLLQGHAEVRQCGQHARLAAGDMVLYDAAQPFEFEVAPREILLARIPRSELQGRFASTQSRVGLALNDSIPGVAPLRAMLRDAMASQLLQQDAAVAQRFSMALLDVLALTLEVGSPPGAAGGSAAERDLYRRIHAYILENLGCAQMSLDTLARQHHVCARTVTRAFARHNQTPMGLVWQLRLQASRQALLQGRCTSVTEAAFAHGFSDAAHFSRAFRKAFGCMPSSLLTA